MTAASVNFTNRRKIKAAFVDLRIVERNESFIRVRVRVDEKVLSGSERYRLVLDAFDRGRHERQTIASPDGQDLDFIGFPADATLRFKVRQIATGDDEGRVIAATADLRPIEIDGKIERDPFIRPVLEDLGPLPWRIEWDSDPSEPRIVLNRRLEEKFGSWRHPVLQALYLPSMLRDLLSGLICRAESIDDLDEETVGGKVMQFCRERLRVEPPDMPFRAPEGDIETWLEWAEDCVMEFSEIKWRKNQTLFDQMMERRA